MFQMRAHKTVSSLVAGLVCLAAPQPSHAASLTKIPGSIAGVVRSSIGLPQSGAAVQLYNRQDHAVLRAVTDERGQFGFSDLVPDVYAVRVTRLPFDPASRPGIAVRAGERTVLTVSLNPLFSSIQISYPTLENGAMSDEWKWVLRSAPSTRPVFRFNPDDALAAETSADAEAEALAQEGQKVQRAAMFSETRGIVRVSAGDRALSAGIGTEADLGTTFALATALYGSSLLQVSGNLGYGAQNGAPAAAFRTSYSRSLLGTTPEISLTMRQMLLPGRVTAAFAGQDGAVPVLRTMSASFDDHVQLSDQLMLQYGSTIDYVSFLDRLNYISPYARLSYHLSEGGELEFAFTSGNARPDLVGGGLRMPRCSVDSTA